MVMIRDMEIKGCNWSEGKSSKMGSVGPDPRAMIGKYFLRRTRR
jgi:hypothetical protein